LDGSSNRRHVTEASHPRRNSSRTLNGHDIVVLRRSDASKHHIPLGCQTDEWPVKSIEHLSERSYGIVALVDALLVSLLQALVVLELCEHVAYIVVDYLEVETEFAFSALNEWNEVVPLVHLSVPKSSDRDDSPSLKRSEISRRVDEDCAVLVGLFDEASLAFFSYSENFSLRNC
jgi:hypothetical protein